MKEFEERNDRGGDPEGATIDSDSDDKYFCPVSGAHFNYREAVVQLM